MRRGIKLIVAIGAMAMIALVVNLPLGQYIGPTPRHSPGIGNNNKGVNVPPLAPAKKRRFPHQIASMVYLNSAGIPTGTIPALKQMGVSQVYLYVAFHTAAYYSIPKNPYGLVEQSDVLDQAIAELHRDGFKVIAVISSALLDHGQVPPSGVAICQPNSDIFDPAKAHDFIVKLTANLLKYHVDGVYIGEPYFSTIANPTPAQQQEWVSLYRQLIKMCRTVNVPIYMILPDLYADGVNVDNISGLPESLTKLPFSSIGIDMENAWQGHPTQDLLRFRNAILKAEKLNPNVPTIIEISLRKGDLKTPIPPSFFKSEVDLMIKYHVDTLVIFANEFWLNSPYRAEYGIELKKFLSSTIH